MPLITSRQHAIVKACRAAARGDDPRMLLDGWHLLEDAVAAALPLDTVAVRADTADARSTLLDDLRTRGVTVVTVSANVMAALAPVHASSGVIALARRPTVTLEALLTPAPPLVVVCAGVQDPGNVGAIVRAADAAGATGVLLDRSSADPWGWKALRGAMGSAFRLPLRREDDVATRLGEWRDRGLDVWITDPHNGVGLYEAALTSGAALVIGGEGGGVPAAIRDLATARLRIPMRPGVESLNAAVAAALVTYEAARQRSGRAIA